MNTCTDCLVVNWSLDYTNLLSKRLKPPELVVQCWGPIMLFFDQFSPSILSVQLKTIGFPVQKQNKLTNKLI